MCVPTRCKRKFFSADGFKMPMIISLPPHHHTDEKITLVTLTIISTYGSELTFTLTKTFNTE